MMTTASTQQTAVVRLMLGHSSRGGAAADVSSFFYSAAATYFKGLESEIFTLMWLRPVAGSRNASTVALGDKPQEKGGSSGSAADDASTVALGDKLQEKGGSSGSAAGSGGGGGGGDNGKGIGSYWGIETPNFTKEDGSEWKWNCSSHRRSTRSDDLRKNQQLPLCSKTIHPDWSSAAIRFHLITTDALENPATPFEYGAGHLQQSEAMIPDWFMMHHSRTI